MDMDMEMDVPLPDELELLEESYRFHEENDFESFPYEDDEAQPSKPESPPSPEPTIDGHKRPRPPKDADEASEEKRGRIGGAGAEEDEEWLRYSPEKVIDPAAEETKGGDSAAEKFVWRFASEVDGEFFPVTAPSGGDRAYTKLSRAAEVEARRGKPSALSGGLIEEPISVLLHKAELEAFAKALQASSGDPGDLVLNETPVVHEQLWVEKYSPNSFTELLSDEQTNREVLLWLKQWDSCVFGSELTNTSTEVLSALRRHSTISQHQKSSSFNYLGRNKGAQWNKENFRNNSEFGYKSKHFDKEDGESKGVQDSSWNKKPRSVGPPEQKILLLCGPPGLGKTTLAHVAARHCGYRVVEINASDDRSAATVEAKILDVVQMNSVTMDARPKCLVIDEIDGSLGEGKGAVDVILKMVSADLKSDSGKENVDKEGNSKKSTKKGRKSQPLLRPVICICNDLYAPVLRPLRNVAKVHVFVQPTVSRVVSRLKYICNKEGMKPNSMGLSTLAQYTECDIRSCLNTLQFLHKKKEALNVLEVSSQVVGRKDMSKSVFDIWKAVFQKKKCIRERRSDITTTNATPSEFESLHSLISSRGEYDLIMDGIHENFLQLHYHDPMMQKTVKCLNNLGISDFLHQYAFRTQHMQLLAYQPGLVIGVHRHVVQVQRPNIEWPKNYQRYRTMLIEKKFSLRSWNNTIQPHISRHLSTSSFVEDSVSLLLHILSPSTLRPVALNSLSEKEKNELEELITKMVSYSITYKNIRFNPFPREPKNEAASESSTLAFDPPINDLVNFKGYNSCHHVLALAMKQVLVHEVEKQRILLVSTGRSGGHLTDKRDKEKQSLLAKETSREKTDKPSAKVHESKTGHSNPSTSATTCDAGPITKSGSETAKPKSFGAAQQSSKGRVDFFDRFRKLSKDPQNTAKATRNDDTSERDLRPVLFKFNEGFTNAVKRPVRMRKFLQ